MDNQDNVTDRTETPVEKPESDEGELIPVKVRENIAASIKRAAQDAQEFEQLANEMADDDVVAEYEERYQPKPKHGEERKQMRFQIPPQHRRPPREDPEHVTENERTWAAIAHASALLTIAVAISSAGIGALLTIFVPMAIHMYYRDKSEYVAHHALQAFAAQAVGIIGFAGLLAAVLTTWIVLIIITALLSIFLIGIPFLILVVILGPLALLATLALPLGMLVYSMIAAVEGWNGHNYSYPWIGDWVDDQLYGRIERSL